MKKQNILLVLKILEAESDRAHPMTQTQLASVISEVYPCDRKTVGRNIKFLLELGYPIAKTPRGYYLDRKPFSVDEREFILNAVRERPDATERCKTDLIERLEFVMNKLCR